MIQESDHRRGETSQGQFAYSQLLDTIATGQLLPGARLREVELAERLGLSRTPVREALRLLEADGLVVHLPRQGATIRRLDYSEVMELYEMRSVFEGTAARLAAHMASAAELRQLDEINSAFAAAENDRAAARLNRQFHAMLLETARNRFLQTAVRGLQKTMLILGPTTLQDSSRPRHAAAEHQAILAALRAGDGPAAEIAMRHHMEAAQSLRLRALRQPGCPIDE